MISSACRRCTKYSWKSSSSPVAIVRTVRTGSSDIGMIVASTSRARAIAAVVSVRVRPVSSSRARSSYCTFVRTRETPGAEYRSLQDVREIAERGREWGCTEALFTLGEAPELRHDEARSWLAERGHSSTISYLLEAARVVLTETGLLPHANPGAVTREEMTRLREVTASQGVMMEELADRLLAPGYAHAGAAGKAEDVRLAQLELAASTRTPFTTGFLIGIGETLAERAHTIAAIAAAVGSDAPSHIQEVIVQNFRAKPDTPMRAADEPVELEMVRAIAAARIALGDRVSVQAPPNLTPKAYGAYIDAGINDWGGISPVTPDHVNPEMPWPSIDEVAETCAARGFTLRQRLPKRRALARADNKPALTAEDVSKAFASHVMQGAYGAPPALEAVGFDEMLP